MENTNITEKTEWSFSKEATYYSDSNDNYVIPHELTVTITLNEYRNLLKIDATAKDQISKATTEKHNALHELEKTKKALNELRDKYYQLIEAKDICDEENKKC